MRSGTHVAAVFGIAALLATSAAGAQNPGTPPDAASPGSAPPGPASPPAAAPEKPAQPAPKPKPPAAPTDKFHTKGGALRVTTLIGATVFNDQKQTIGNISDVLLNKDSKAAEAVLSVGGFLGVGSRLVVVPFADLHIDGDRVVLPGATKVSLENLSAYQAGE